MNRAKIFIFFIAAGLLFWSCQPTAQPDGNQDEQTQPDPGSGPDPGPTPGQDDTPTLEIREGNLMLFSSMPTEEMLHTNLSEGTLTCTSDQTWCHIRVDAYARPFVINVEVDAFGRDADAPREATLTIALNGKIVGTVQVFQDPVARLEAPKLLGVPAGGGTFRFQVATNIYHVDAAAGASTYDAWQYDNSILSDISTDRHYVIFTIAPWDVTLEKPKPASIRVSAREQVAKFVRIEYLDPDMDSGTLPYDELTPWD